MGTRAPSPTQIKNEQFWGLHLKEPRRDLPSKRRKRKSRVLEWFFPPAQLKEKNNSVFFFLFCDSFNLGLVFVQYSPNSCCSCVFFSTKTNWEERGAWLLGVALFNVLFLEIIITSSCIKAAKEYQTKRFFTYRERGGWTKVTREEAMGIIPKGIARNTILLFTLSLFLPGSFSRSGLHHYMC